MANKKSKSKYKKLYNAGGTLDAIGGGLQGLSPLAAMIPGAGPLASLGVSALGSILRESGPPTDYTPMGANANKHGFARGGKLTPLSTQTRQVIANNPNSTDSVELPNAFVDHNETISNVAGGQYVFPDKLNPSTGNTFAEDDKQLAKAEKKAEKRASSGDPESIATIKYISKQREQMANLNESIKGLQNMAKKMELSSGGKMSYEDGGFTWADWSGPEGDRKVQQLLKDQGYYDGPIKDQMDRAVGEAVRRFQAANNLTVDGIAGKNTLTALSNASKKTYNWGPKTQSTLATPKQEPLGDSYQGVPDPEGKLDPFVSASINLASVGTMGLGGPAQGVGRAAAVATKGIGPRKLAETAARNARRGNLTSWGEYASPKAVQGLKDRLLNYFSFTKSELDDLARQGTGSLDEWVNFPKAVGDKVMNPPKVGMAGGGYYKPRYQAGDWYTDPPVGVNNRPGGLNEAYGEVPEADPFFTGESTYKIPATRTLRYLNSTDLPFGSGYPEKDVPLPGNPLPEVSISASRMQPPASQEAFGGVPQDSFPYQVGSRFQNKSGEIYGLIRQADPTNKWYGRNQLTDPGNYIVTQYDAAGNPRPTTERAYRPQDAQALLRNMSPYEGTWPPPRPGVSTDGTTIQDTVPQSIQQASKESNSPQSWLSWLGNTLRGYDPSTMENTVVNTPPPEDKERRRPTGWFADLNTRLRGYDTEEMPDTEVATPKSRPRASQLPVGPTGEMIQMTRGYDRQGNPYPYNANPNIPHQQFSPLWHNRTNLMDPLAGKTQAGLPAPGPGATVADAMSRMTVPSTSASTKGGRGRKKKVDPNIANNMAAGIMGLNLPTKVDELAPLPTRTGEEVFAPNVRENFNNAEVTPNAPESDQAVAAATGTPGMGDLLQLAEFAGQAGMLFRGADKQNLYQNTAPIGLRQYDPARALQENQYAVNAARQGIQGSSTGATRMSNLQNLAANQMRSQNQIVSQYDQMNRAARDQYEGRLAQRDSENIRYKYATDQIRQQDRAAFTNQIRDVVTSVGNYGRAKTSQAENRKAQELMIQAYPDIAKYVMDWLDNNVGDITLKKNTNTNTTK